VSLENIKKYTHVIENPNSIWNEDDLGGYKLAPSTIRITDRRE
jgi:hypothetical protein